MTKLIDDLLDFSRISFDDKKFEEIDLNKILSDVVLDLDLKIAEKKAEVKWNGDLPKIEAVPLQMRQLFYNLIFNALKFAKPNIAPRILISHRLLSKEEIRQRKSLDTTGRCIEIVFSDNGIGFDPQFAEQIFIIFQRLNDRKQYPGTGMGLAIGKKIVANHKGDIYATSAGEGASFHVILPVKQPKTE
jgi:light-regulated signal transduction histidine kinase (bacteriophytochrome)